MKVQLNLKREIFDGVLSAIKMTERRKLRFGIVLTNHRSLILIDGFSVYDFSFVNLEKSCCFVTKTKRAA